MKYSILVMAVAAALGLSACEKTTTVQPVAVPVPASPPAVVAVPGPKGEPGAPGAPGPQGDPGEKGAPGKGGNTVVIVPPDRDRK